MCDQGSCWTSRVRQRVLNRTPGLSDNMSKRKLNGGASAPVRSACRISACPSPFSQMPARHSLFLSLSQAPSVSVKTSSHPLILHKITQMRKVTNTPKYLNQLMKEVSTFLCYEATADMALEACDVKTREGDEQGQRIAETVGIVPVLRGGLGMVEAMTEMVSNAQVWHLGIYRDKKSLLPIEYYNKLPKKVTVHTVFVLDPMPISGATAVAAMDILKAWGEGLKGSGKTLKIVFICIVAAASAIDFIKDAHPDVTIVVGAIDKPGETPMMPGMGDIADRLFGTDPEECTPLE